MSPYTVRKTLHYGSDYRVTEHTGAFIIDAIVKAAPDMPDKNLEEALTALRNGEPYRGWSWMTLELVGALDIMCPACLARPGKPCTQPTETSRKNVSWFHFARIDATQYPEES